MNEENMYVIILLNWQATGSETTYKNVFNK
jgi:hypothetical protein